MSRSEAEDVAQETFVALGAQRLDPRVEPALRAWLLRTAINRGLNVQRGRSRRLAREASVGPTLAGAPAPAPDHLHQRQRVRAALLALEPRARTLLVLRATGLRYAELAETIGVAPSSIGTLLARAQQAFYDAYRAPPRSAP